MVIRGHAPCKSLTARALPVHLHPRFSNNCYLCHLKIRISLKINILPQIVFVLELIFPLPQPYIDTWAGRYSCAIHKLPVSPIYHVSSQK